MLSSLRDGENMCRGLAFKYYKTISKDVLRAAKGTGQLFQYASDKFYELQRLEQELPPEEIVPPGAQGGKRRRLRGTKKRRQLKSKRTRRH
jgi:hypothetical protein